MGRSRVKINMPLMRVVVEQADESTHRQWTGEPKDTRLAGLIVRLPADARRRIAKRYIEGLLDSPYNETDELAVSLVLDIISEL